MNKKIAIVGGAFDPITIAHLKIVEAISKDSYNFDEVWIMPCYNHRFGKNMTSFDKRLNLILEALHFYKSLSNNYLKKVHTSAFEFNYEIKDGTYSLLKELQKSYTDCNFSFVIGMDNAINFEKWKSYKQLLEEANFVVVPRVGVNDNIDKKWWLEGRHCEIKEQIPQVSSTEIRDLFKQYYLNNADGKALRKLLEFLPYGTYKMIVNYDLYKP